MKPPGQPALGEMDGTTLESEIFWREMKAGAAEEICDPSFTPINTADTLHIAGISETTAYSKLPPSDFDVNWTEVMMERVGWRMNGLSVHFYTVHDWNAKGSATQFTSGDYYRTLAKCSGY